MSGAQIGTVVGGAIGAFFGGPAGAQLGMAIGGTIGGIVDPTRINGPRIGDGQQQASTDGAPIAWVQGTAMIAGTLVQASTRRQVRHHSGGKGGPSVTTYTAAQDFAILVCESCSLRNSTIASVLAVIEDGKIVYDTRPGVSSQVLTASSKWKSGVDFLFGDEAQLPHPTLEAITGVGNTPSYRGSLVAVFKNWDISAAGTRIPSYQFIVSSAGAPLSIQETDPNWKYYSYPAADTNDYSATGFDDSGWATGPGPFGTYTFLGGTFVASGPVGSGIWVRRGIICTAGADVTVLMRNDDSCQLWWNGVSQYSDASTNTDQHSFTIPASQVLMLNTIAFKDRNDYDYGNVLASLAVSQAGAITTTPTLDQVVSNIALRGGLKSTDIDVSALASQTVIGYPIARQMKATDAIAPVVGAYFAYGAEWDAKLRFAFSGANAAITIDRGDLLEGNDANKGDIVANLRNQFTEFPRRVVVTYLDPAQNFYPVYLAAERRASGVIATGDQTISMPVVMPANDAAQAAHKALKVAYALLEGTLDYSVPFAGTMTYLTLAPGDPIIFQGKRYVVSEQILSTGYMKLTTQYDRQSAYTSTVQAIPGNAPLPSSSKYSGPTTLIAMNLPALRPQDTVGVYLCTASSTGSTDWQGCTVQISYDAQASWQTAAIIGIGSVLGTVASALSVGAEPLVVNLLGGSLSSATAAQLYGGANAWATVSQTSGAAQVGQFTTAAEVGTSEQYSLTGISGSRDGIAQFPIASGDAFTMLDAAYFLPIDPAYQGRTLYFRGVGINEIAQDATIVSLVYTALTNVPGVQLVAEDGTTALIAENGIDLLFTE